MIVSIARLIFVVGLVLFLVSVESFSIPLLPRGNHIINNSYRLMTTQERIILNQDHQHQQKIVFSSKPRAKRRATIWLSSSTNTGSTKKNINNTNSETTGSSPQNPNHFIRYGIASVDLSAKWLELVQNDQVTITTTIPSYNKNCNDDDDDMIAVRYGVRLLEGSTDATTTTTSKTFIEFVEPGTTIPKDGTIDVKNIHPKIASINATLSQVAASSSSSSSSCRSLQYRKDGLFVAQLQLVRTLRPPPSPGFGTSSKNKDMKSSSRPPPYNSETDSFVTGPLRLQLRPLVAQLQSILSSSSSSSLSLTTDWDVYHNISPADVRGHFLLLPTLQDRTKKNWREQALIMNDCHDLVWLTSSINPIGSLLICFNSVGAGASQNHIHCHMWPSPPTALLSASLSSLTSREEKKKGDSNKGDDDGSDHSHSHSHEHTHSATSTSKDTMGDNGWSCYAVSRIESIYDFADIVDEIDNQPLVEVSYLDYPCFCIQLSSVVVDGADGDNDSSSTPQNHHERNKKSLDALGQATWNILSCLDDSPHNVCMLNRPATPIYEGEEEGKKNDNIDATVTLCNVDVYIFVRSRERSPNIVSASKLGASEMMGVFHCQSLEQLNELVPGEEVASYNRLNVMAKEEQSSPMIEALQDVSHEHPVELWETIKEKLLELGKT